MLVHLARADLHLDARAFRADDRGVNGAVEVVLGSCDVVVELARDRSEGRVDDAKRRITRLDRLDDDAHGANVVELAEGELFALHLAMNAVEVLRPALDLCADAGGGELRAQPLAERGDVAFAIRALLVERERDAVVRLGLEIPEGEVLELPFQLPDAEAIRERRKHGASRKG